MEELLHANVFFYITSGAVILVAAMVLLILYKVYKVLQVIHRVLTRIELGSERIAHDVAHARELFQSGGIFMRVAQFFGRRR